MCMLHLKHVLICTNVVAVCVDRCSKSKLDELFKSPSMDFLNVSMHLSQDDSLMSLVVFIMLL